MSWRYSLEFGYEKDGQPVSSVTEPVLVAEDVKDIATGDRHSCLLKNNGSLWTCGENNYSQTGVEDADATGSLTQILEGVRSVSAGSLHNFAVCTDGSVYAWGYGLSGQLGAGNGERQTVPTLTDFDYVQVFACDDNTFGVTAKGYLYSFGDNTNYRLGKSDGTDSLTPMCILDKDMNWVYDEFKDGAGPDYAVDGNTTPNNAPSVSEPEVSEPEVTEPEIVSTPFIRGYGDNTFRPNGSITRAEFVKMLVTALCDDYEPGPDNNNYGACTFTDVSVGAWYNPYLAYAQQKESSDGEKYVSGYKDGTFNPNGTITRAEAAKVTAVFLDLDIKSAPDAEYDDVDPENWSAPYINALTQNGAIQGDGNGLFRPKGNITRAEAAKIVAAALNFRPNAIEEEELLSSVSECPFTDVDPEKWYYVYLLRGVGYVK